MGERRPVCDGPIQGARPRISIFSIQLFFWLLSWLSGSSSYVAYLQYLHYPLSTSNRL